jgi:type IV pilus assembly protein PilP
MNAALTRTLCVAVALASLAACDDPPPVQNRPTAPAPTPGASVEDLTTAEDSPEVAYAYSPIGKRDPFRSFFEEFRNEANSPELTELQRFEVDQLKLVAVVTGRATPYAMVEDPSGKGHTVTRGTLIGKNWGRVAAIATDCVQVREEYRDYTGRKVTNTIPMCIPKPDDELKLD